jgi:sulfur relay (sulfurtransferase) DsrC/TusE family protein
MEKNPDEIKETLEQNEDGYLKMKEKRDLEYSKIMEKAESFNLLLATSNFKIIKFSRQKNIPSP